MSSNSNIEIFYTSSNIAKIKASSNVQVNTYSCINTHSCYLVMYTNTFNVTQITSDDNSPYYDIRYFDYNKSIAVASDSTVKLYDATGYSGMNGTCAVYAVATNTSFGINIVLSGYSAVLHNFVCSVQIIGF